MAAPLYIVYNSAMATAAAPVKQPTGTAIRTMLQLKPAVLIRPRAWGMSFDGSAAATPGTVELVETDVACTITTAFAAADVQPYSPANAAANTAGASGTPLNLSTTASGFASAAGTEGTITATRMADVQLVAPTDRDRYQWPLDTEFECQVGKFLRIRVTFATTVNMICWIIFQVG